MFPILRRVRAYDRFGIAAFGLALHGALFLRQPVLAEARQFLFERGGIASLDPLAVLRGVLEPTGSNTRYVSMLSFRFLRDAFGYLPEPLNLAEAALVAVAAVLVLDYVAALTASRRTGRVVAVLWLLSAATANAMSWQASHHDKLAIVFSLAALLAVGTAGSTSRREDWTRALLATLLAALAVNSKEIAFFLPAVLAVQGALFAGVRALVPALYVAGFAAAFLLRLTPQWGSHAFGQEPAAGVFPYLAALMNVVRDDFGALRLADGGMRVAAVAALSAAVIAAGVAYAIAARRDATGLRARGLAVLATFGVASFAIVLRSGASVYALLVPAVGFLGTVVVIVEDLAARVRGRPVLAWARAGLVGWYAATFAWLLMPGHALARHLLAGRHVAAAHVEMRRQVPATATGPFVLVFDGGNARLRWLFFDHSERCVMNFALRRDGDLPHSIAVGARPTGADSGYLFLFDEELRLREIVDGRDAS